MQNINLTDMETIWKINEAPPIGGSKWFAHLPIGGGGSWNFDAEFKFAKIQNSHVEGGGAHGILMLSSNLLKSKIPMLRVGLMEF